MNTARRELFWSLLLFLLLSGGVSFADPETSAPLSSLLKLSGTCAKSPANATACARALRSLLDNSAKPSHLAWIQNGVHILPGVMLDQGEKNLEEIIQTRTKAELEKIPFSHYFALATERKPNRELSIEAFNAFLSSTDPHAHIAINNSEELWGIGAYLRRHLDKLYVTAVIPHSEAARRGLSAGDEIISINGTSAALIPNFQRREIFRRATLDGKFLDLGVQREKSRFVMQTRAEHLFLRNITESLHGEVVVLKVNSFFRDDSCADIARSLHRLDKNKIRGIVLDLRDNPGGLVRQAICVGGLFLGPNILMASFKPLPDSKGSSYKLFTKETLISRLPLVVLVNQNTASSAEILAAALQDQKRATVVGEKTFGKGTMQSMQTLDDGEILVYRSTHRILRASGVNIQRIGVEPNYPIQDTKHEALREINLFESTYQKYGPLEARHAPTAKKTDPCSANAFRQNTNALDISAALLHCSF